MLYRFGDVTFDTERYELRRAGATCHLEPQVFTILHYLIAHRERVVTRQELLEHVWPERFISETTLDHRVMQARQAVGDSGQTQRVIQTLRGRGYRFVAAVEEAGMPSPAVVPAPVASPSAVPIVGRAAELAQVHQWYAMACQGQRQVVWITGDMGLGKTTLVDAFVAQVTAGADLWSGRGQCLAQHGPGEAYMPLLEALSQVGRSPHGGEVVALLRQYAPSWLPHLPALVPVREREALLRQAGGTTRERMLRELAEAVEAVTLVRPLVLVLEDLHWSDHATLDWLAYVARRREPARLLVLGTYRSVEAAVQAHPVRQVSQELHVHGQSAEVALPSLSAEAVRAYLAQRFAGASLPEGLAPVLHQRTTGNPLFLVRMVDALVRQGVLRAGATAWEFVGELETVAASIPENLRQLLERHVEQLPVAEQALLEAASVVGVEFAVAAVAAAGQRSVADVEEWCAAWARRGQFLRVCGVDAWPDGTVATRYGFLHALYRDTLYERIPVGRRVRWHRQIGDRLEAGHAPHARERAVELAEHFVRGHDTVRAVRYLHYAVEQAMQRSAHQAALQHCTQGLALLATLPETPARGQQELDLLINLGSALLITKGPGHAEVAQTYTRARALCAQVGDTPRLVSALWGLSRFYQNRGALSMGLELGEQLYQLAQSTAVPMHLLAAHDVLGQVLYFQGHYSAAQTHYAQSMAGPDTAQPWGQGFRGGLAPEVSCRALLANTLWCLGYPEQALRRSQEALALAQALGHPNTLAFTHLYAANLHQRRREVRAVQAQAEALLTLATMQGLALWVEFGTYWRGWVLAMQGQTAEGLAQMRQGTAALLAMGQMLPRPAYLVLLAEATGRAGQVDAGLDLVAEALAAFEAGGRRDALSEAYRVQGELWLQQTVPDATQAEACFQQALAIARQQQARSWELRAAVSLSCLWQRQGKRQAARELLAPIYAWFTEGFETPDLQEAREAGAR